MSNVNCLSRRLVHALAQSPKHTTTHLIAYRTSLTWIRTITQSSQSTLTVSFGAENDAILAPHLQKLREKEIKAKSRKSGRFDARNKAIKADFETLDSEISNTVGADSFEIEDYVDRSTRKSQSSRAESAQETGDTTLARDQAYPKNGSAMRGDSRNLDKSSRKDSSVARRDRNDRLRTNAKSDPRVAPPLKKREDWQIQKNALKQKFGGDSWNPRKKISPDAIEGIRGLHEQDPTTYSTEVLASQFQVSAEAIRRILKSKWSQNISPEKKQERRERWARRHDRIWDRQAELGLRPERVKDKEVEDPDQFEKDMERRKILGEI